MQLRQVIFLILGFISSTAFASGSRPIEVLSDAYGAGVPTQYTVLRDNSRLTFSLPYFGQFTRAEIRTSDQSGITTTRFVLSADGKTYRPVMLNEEPHMIHNMAKDDGATCEDTSLFATTASEITNIEAAAKFDAAVKKKTKELKAAKFFDASCFDKEMSKEDQDAIIAGVAQVLVREQPIRSPDGPRYLACLDEYGFAHEAGLIQALMKQTIDKPKMPNELTVKCQLEHDGTAGSFDTATNTITLNVTPKPDRDTYARAFFHEVTHSANVLQHEIMIPVENCCGSGVRCPLLSELSEKLKKQKEIAAATFNTPFSTRASESAVCGASFDDGAVVQQSKFDTLKNSSSESYGICRAALAENQLIAKQYGQCIAPTSPVGSTEPAPSKSGLLFLLSIDRAHAAQTECPPIVHAKETQDTFAHLKSQIDKLPDNSSTADLIALGTRTSPIPWSGPVTQGVDTDALALAAATRSKSQNKPTRGIASISTENPGATLGSSSNRRDLQKGRATFLIDTAEKAAREVASTLTAETINKRSVARAEAYKEMQKSSSAQFVVASLKDKPVQFAKLDGLNLGFENPFLKNAPKTKEQTLSQTLAATRNAGQQKPIDPTPLSGSDGARS
ncbi:MAG: hypothetical protein JNJ49_13495, partial [Bdellovibrionaceae bacterium]|nr:hypothetical protein [Pseudobdellovibrionaceae bacterium]